jgi:hypothetical protein
MAVYQNPSANVSGILSSLMTPQQPTYKSITTPTLMSDEEKRKQGLLSE